MTRREIRLVERVMEGWHVGYVYLYPMGGGKRKAFVFDLLPENIASFIYRNQYDASRIEVTDLRDRMLLNIDARGGSEVQNRDLCQRVVCSLQAILNGSTPAEFVIVTRELYDRYRPMEGVVEMEAAIARLMEEEV